MTNALDVFQERGFFKQVTHEDELRQTLATRKVTAYVGFDPTADSLHVGHLMGIMALAHLQRTGHQPMALVGGGTVMIGDPSGRTELRQILSPEVINQNANKIKKQLGNYLNFGDDQAVLVNNADWILPLNYIEFLREIGSQFSVNRMLTAECFRARMERGLSFIEFNYMLLQAYDFLLLNRKYGCVLQMGGDDQWSNILAGADLIRRLEGKAAFGLTWPLLTTASGKKMGKTEAGAVWLDPAKTEPFAFYQYWRNTHDADVERFLAYFTFLPMDEVRRMGALQDREINEAKKILAFEATKLAHGEEEARKAEKTAERLFEDGAAGGGALPVTSVEKAAYPEGISLLDLLVLTKLASSKKEGRRLIDQGGLQLEKQPVTEVGLIINPADYGSNGLLLQKGKKVFHKVEFK